MRHSTVDPRWCPAHGLSKVMRQADPAYPDSSAATVTWYECPACIAAYGAERGVRVPNLPTPAPEASDARS